jgi:2-desacetyl-2-hydroxyethyl bacteriochlorophyllide A dehydrogenase
VKAAVLYGPKDLRVESTKNPSASQGEVLVRVRASGLCGTDDRIWSGDRPVRYPLILGHEFIGEVVEVGDGVSRVRPGDRVAIEPNYSCGRCRLCREGKRNLCLARTAIGIDVHGGFAELAVVPERCVWAAPRSLTDDQLLLTEPLAVVVRAVARSEAAAGECAVVLGAGTLGLLAAQVLRARGVRVLLLSRSPRRLELARKLGVEEVASLADRSGVELVRHFSNDDGVDLVIETAGTAEAVEEAVKLVRPAGRVVLVGLPHSPSSISFFSVVRRELSLIGSMIYRDEFPQALELLADGSIEVAPLITHRFSLDAVHAAFSAYKSAEAIKIAVLP